MLMTKLKRAMAVLLSIAFLGAGAGATKSTSQTEAAENDGEVTATAPAWGTPRNGLRLGVYRTGGKGEGKVRLMVVLENASSDDLVVNLGLMLGNGKKQLPTAVRLIFTSADGKKRIFQRKVGGIAGRVDPFVVPLAAGGRYMIRCDPGEYYDADAVGAQIAPGRYRVSGEFVGKAVTRNEVRDNSGLALMTYWTGTIQSGDIQVTMPLKPAN
jgi:hypothetical protein